MLTGLNVDECFERSEPGCCGPLSYVTDALDSTQSLLDTNGTPQVQYEYAPFGNTDNTIFNVSTASSYAYTGRENDGYGLAQLYFYRGRYYSPTFQRFISQDPIDFGGGDTNLYAYVGNDPVDFIDPIGAGRIGAIVGGTVGAAAGAVGEATEDAAIGTVAEPGAGTAVGAVVGAALGATQGAATGAQIGSAIQDAITGVFSGLRKLPSLGQRIPFTSN